MSGGGICVVIPCAGAGRRLGLPYPKELLALGPGRTLIDAALDLVPRDRDVRVVVVVSPEKVELVRYLGRYAGELPIAFVHQLPDLSECTGAVLSARPWFGDLNVVLLPDELIEPATEAPQPVASLLDAIANEPFAFLAQLESDPDRLRAEGALHVTEAIDGRARVVDLADKPTDPLDRFNAVWTGFAFRREAATAALTVLHHGTTGRPVSAAELRASPLYGAPIVPVAACTDVGTWDAVQRMGLAMGSAL